MSNAEERVREVISTIAKDKFPTASDVRVKPTSSFGANYSGSLYEATIVTPTDTIELFVKVISMGNDLSNANEFVLINENFVYVTLAGFYEKLQDKHGVSERFTFPKFYKSGDGVPIVVMENLVIKGYECYDRLKSVNWEYASKSVECIARFHALSLALQKEDPEEFKSVKDVLKSPSEIAKASQWEGLQDAGLAILDEEDRGILSRLLEGSEGFSVITDLSAPRKTSVIIHGDYRPSNIMHKDVNGTFHIIPVDYQTAQLGCPVADLLYFIVTSTDQQFRQKHFHQLVDHYYQHLELMMTKLGLQPEEVYGREEFYEDMKAKLPSALCVASAVLLFVTVDSDGAPNFEENQYIPRASKLFGERFRGLMDDFKQWGIV